MWLIAALVALIAVITVKLILTRINYKLQRKLLENDQEIFRVLRERGFWE